jgi:hypothetical protein
MLWERSPYELFRAIASVGLSVCFS